MKLTYPICCGVDVHKTFLVATIITSEYVMPHYRQKRFSTFYNGLVAFKKWLLEYDCKDVCMESTGKYWVPVWNVLEDSCHVVIANPKWVSAVKGNKDDKKDSKWIGDLFRMGLVPSSYIPSKDIRIRVSQNPGQRFRIHAAGERVCRECVPLRYNYDKPEKPRISRVAGLWQGFSSFSKPKNRAAK